MFDANNVITGVTDALATSIDALIAGAGQLAVAVATFFTDLYNDHVDEINSMVTFFENIGEGFTNALDDIAQTTWEGFAHFGEAVAGSLGSVWTALSGIPSAIVTTLTSIPNAALTWLSGLGSTITTAISNFFGDIGGQLTAALDNFSESVWTGITNFGGAVAGALGTAWTNLTTFGAGITEAATTWLAARGTEIQSALGTAWTNISTFLGNITGTASAWLEARGTEIQAALGTAWTNLTTFLGNITGTATAWLEAAGTQIESALGTAYVWLKAKYAAAENTIDQIIEWFGTGTDQLGTAATTFFEAAKSALFNGLVPSAFAESEADGQITASLASGGNIKNEIGEDIKDAFVTFAADLSNTIITSGNPLVTILANISTFLTGTTQTGANTALSNLASVAISQPLTFSTSLNNTGTNSSTGIGKNTDGDMFFKVPAEDQFFFQSNGNTIFEAVMDSSTRGYLKLRGNTSDPSPGEGGIWYNTTDNKFKFREGSSDVELGGGLTRDSLDDFFDDELTSVAASGLDYDSDYFLVQDVEQFHESRAEDHPV